MAGSLNAAKQGILAGNGQERSRSDELLDGKITPEDLLTIVDELRVAVESLRGDAGGLDQSFQALEELAEEVRT